MKVYEIIRQQLGNQALLLLGANGFVHDDKSLSFRIRGCRKINKIKITLDPVYDSYKIEFIKFSELTDKQISYYPIVYFDQLHELIEKETGLLTNICETQLV